MNDVLKQSWGMAIPIFGAMLGMGIGAAAGAAVGISGLLLLLPSAFFAAMGWVVAGMLTAPATQ